MAQVDIHYNIRRDENSLPTLRLFADEECAKADQELFGWTPPQIGSFTLYVKGQAYVDAVSTREDYIEELKLIPKTPKVLQLIKNLSR